MLPSDPSPKATSVPPTTFKVGDRVRVKRFGMGPDVTAVVSSLPVDFTGRSQVVFEDNVREWCAPEELVHDVAPPKPTNNVDHPRHYTAGSIETIDAIEALVGQAGWSPLTGYRLGNVLKYLWRHVHKGGLESLKKAAWYLEREIEAQEKKP